MDIDVSSRILPQLFARHIPQCDSEADFDRMDVFNSELVWMVFCHPIIPHILHFQLDNL